MDIVNGIETPIYNRLIRDVKDFYINERIPLRTMTDYEVVCKTILDVFPRLRMQIIHSCQLENAAPRKKAQKRLQPHVRLKFIRCFQSNNLI